LKDEHIPRAEIDAVVTAAVGNNHVEVQLYPDAGHGFFNRPSSSADEIAVISASAHIDRFFSQFG
jgi:dienelactone hydrolase